MFNPLRGPRFGKYRVVNLTTLMPPSLSNLGKAPEERIRWRDNAYFVYFYTSRWGKTLAKKAAADLIASCAEWGVVLTEAAALEKIAEGTSYGSSSNVSMYDSWRGGGFTTVCFNGDPNRWAMGNVEVAQTRIYFSKEEE